MIRNLLGYLKVYRKSPIFIIIIRHQLDLDRPVSASSNRLQEAFILSPQAKYSDTSANEDNSFRYHIR